jgi:hypothetical protein
LSLRAVAVVVSSPVVVVEQVDYLHLLLKH